MSVAGRKGRSVLRHQSSCLIPQTGGTKPRFTEEDLRDTGTRSLKGKDSESKGRDPLDVVISEGPSRRDF